ncbi:hypothetical protein BT63DRAFT_479089 [Microthyrium microscopicum]|uniref:Uncharacterized protein n=1 Tax=Microthyrium microscopicum TaxID=703497 RepID=A0A6A6UAC8_9PEZI|nr:hypothetical protein BT63DRAFT_479089 [Microthyrium microscopicum]
MRRAFGKRLKRLSIGAKKTASKVFSSPSTVRTESDYQPLLARDGGFHHYHGHDNTTSARRASQDSSDFSVLSQDPWDQPRRLSEPAGLYSSLPPKVPVKRRKTVHVHLDRPQTFKQPPLIYSDIKEWEAETPANSPWFWRPQSPKDEGYDQLPESLAGPSNLNSPASPWLPGRAPGDHNSGHEASPQHFLGGGIVASPTLITPHSPNFSEESSEITAMPKPKRTGTGDSLLSLRKISSQVRITRVNSDPEAVEEQVQEEEEEEDPVLTELRKTLQASRETIRARRDHNYEAGFEGKPLTSLARWRELEQAERRSKIFPPPSRIVMSCDTLDEPVNNRMSFLVEDATSHQRVLVNMTAEDVEYRRKVNHIRLEKMKEAIQLVEPRAANTANQGESSGAAISDHPLFRDNQDEYERYQGELRRKVFVNISPEPTFSEMQHVTTPLEWPNDLALPREILAKVNLEKTFRKAPADADTDRSAKRASGPRILVDLFKKTNRDDEGDGTNDGKRLSDISLDVDPPDDGIPSVDNPFSSLYGKCKRISMAEVQDLQVSDELLQDEVPHTISREMISRLSMHEGVRRYLIITRPKYDSAEQTVRAMISEWLETASIEEITKEKKEKKEKKENADEEVGSCEESIIGIARLGLSFAQGWLDRCIENGW